MRSGSYRLTHKTTLLQFISLIGGFSEFAKIRKAYIVRGNEKIDINLIKLTKKVDLEYNILITVNSTNADHPLDVYRFFRDEVQTSWLQFIPVIERLSDGEVTAFQKGATVSDRSVRPGQWGDFLTTIFDEWVRRDVGRIFVQTFEAAVRSWMNLGSSGMCIFDPTCGLQ